MFFNTINWYMPYLAFLKHRKLTQRIADEKIFRNTAFI